MTVSELIAGLRAQDIRVWLEEERVRVSAPSGRLTAELQQLYHGLGANRSGGQPGGDSGSSGPDDDVIDADFTVN